MTLADRFWAKVERSDSCWLWRGAANHLGYGCMRIERRSVRATAVSLFLASGEWPTGHICHRCDSPPCVNPEHLFLGTAVDNMRDCIAKGRFKFLKPRLGPLNVNAKLTWEQVADLRQRYAAGENLSQLSRSFGMARSSLRRIVRCEGWVSA